MNIIGKVGERLGFAILRRVMAWPRSLFLVPLLWFTLPSEAIAYEAPVLRGGELRSVDQVRGTSALRSGGELRVADGLEGFSQTERQELLENKSVTKASSFNREGRKYLSAISYQVVKTTPQELFALLQQVEETLPRALPATHRARYVGSAGENKLVEIVHGNAFINGKYTVVWNPLPEQNEVRFWMAAARHHDVDDVWGFFRVTPIDGGERSLVTVAVAVNLGKGGIKSLYASKIHKALLKSARYIRKYVDQRPLSAKRLVHVAAPQAKR